MPRGDGTGPFGGSGKGTGRGMGQRGRTGMGKGSQMSRMQGLVDPEGECFCPNCGSTIPHRPGIPCSLVRCPQCETLMVRK
ncbi:MAG: hypothetical protein SVW57_06630 [Thermodesulfobacteriota bacterium]|nr:hypothetical protein [Thermodesulfobacteriota bacterium]